jgi:hypothetical protein
MVCKALRDHGVTAPIDVHLMVSPVDQAILDFAAAGASYITFHPEATNHVDRSLQLIRNAGCKAGLVFNPATSLDAARFVMDKLDIILLMSVSATKRVMRGWLVCYPFLHYDFVAGQPWFRWTGFHSVSSGKGSSGTQND